MGEHSEAMRQIDLSSLKADSSLTLPTLRVGLAEFFTIGLGLIRRIEHPLSVLNL